MAEVTGLRNNALPYPIYGAPFGVTFPLLDADGDPISPSTPDSEISKNGDTFADCTNEATEIATSSGSCYLLLTGTELTCDVATIQVKSTGAKTTVLSLYPRKLVTIRSGTAASGGVSTSTIVLDASASAVDDFYNGMVCIATIDSNVEVRVISDYTGSTQTATVVPDWNVAPDSDDTFVVKLPEGVQLNQANVTHIESVDATNQIRDAVVDDATRIDASALNTASGLAAGATGFAAIDTVVDTILVDTNELQTDWTNGGRLDLIIDAILDDTDLIDDGTSGLAKIATDVAAVLIDTSTTLQGELDGIQADTEDIQAKIGSPSDFGSGTSTLAANLQDMADNGTATFDRSTDSLQAIRDHVGDGTNLTEAGGTGDHLTAINLPNQTMDIVGNITGNLSGSVGSVTGLTASNLDATVSSRMPTTHIAATAGKVDGVALVDTTTTNTDMRGTDSAATAASLATTDGKVDDIKTKTDSLTFTIAGQVDANIQSVNDVTVTGTGATGDEWGP